MRHQRMFWWVIGSAALMVIGAFGPWVKALGIGVSGTDGSNDGWIVVIAAILGALLFYGMRANKAAGIWPLLAGLVGAATTIYDRQHISSEISKGGEFARAIAQVGWG